MFHTLTFLLFGSLTEFCQCTRMTAGDKFEYLWKDSQHIPETYSLPASEYIGNAMQWIDSLTNSEEIFPKNSMFPTTFLVIVKKIFSRLFRVFAHIYHSHIDQVRMLEMEIHLNTTFKHLYVMRFIFSFKKKLDFY